MTLNGRVETCAVPAGKGKASATEKWNSEMGVKILLVEDSRVIRAMVGATLRPFDCTIIEANDGQEGLDLAERHKPDLIILDYSMPEMDGYEMLTRLRQVANLRTIPVMMLTSEASREKVVMILKLGVRDYLVKPLNEEVIAERIGRLVTLTKKPSTILRDRRYDDSQASHRKMKKGLEDIL